MYCGQLSPKFNLAGLEQHYEKDCAMLTTCPSCSEVVETRYLSEHELFECEKRLNFKQCERCQQAVVADLYARHKTSKKCKLLPADGSVGRCPLCSEDVLPNNDLGWRTHLMSECPSNPRLKRRKKKPKAAAK
ncbi:hypothetical protein M3Y99_00844500 [Aphelenchoides fujianensis]|nr:hypothetical protein M3Y99_00844500 [Aphelenchoides fujianensis]